MKEISLFATLLLLVFNLQAQEREKVPATVRSTAGSAISDTVKIDSATRRAVNIFINKSLRTVATGVGDGANFATYGSFDPVKGDYKLNLYGAWGDTKPVFYNFSVSGKIVGDNAGVLFDNSKFNSSTSISGKIHIPIQTKVEAGRNSRLKEVLKKVKDLKNATEARLAVISNDMRMRNDSIAYLQTRFKLDKATKELGKIQDSIDAAYTEIKKAQFNEKTSKNYVELIARLKPKLVPQTKLVYDLQDEQDQLRQQLDEAHLRGLSRSRAMSRQIGKERFLLEEDLKNKADSLFNTVTASGISAKWISLVGNYARNKYYTFNGALPFSQQIRELNDDKFNFGAEFNWYIKNTIAAQRFQDHTIFLNIGVMFKQANDIDQYSTSEVNKSAKYTLLDSTNTLSKKYNVYTDPINEYKALRVYGSLYYFLGKNNSAAVHLFPDVEFRNSHHKPFNVGAGFIFAVKKKDNSIFNIELYNKFIDIGKALPTSTGSAFLKRNEIGLNFSVPVNLIL